MYKIRHVNYDHASPPKLTGIMQIIFQEKKEKITCFLEVISVASNSTHRTFFKHQF